MITEFMPGDPRGLAASVFVRNVLGCVGTTVAAPMLDALGNGWTFTLGSLVALAGASIIVAITKFGSHWSVSCQYLVKIEIFEPLHLCDKYFHGLSLSFLLC